MVRKAWKGLDRGDLEEAFKDVSPDVEFDQTRALGMDRGVYTLDEFERLTQSFIKAWLSVRWDADEFIDAGEHVVLAFTNRLTGRDGITLEAHGTLVWTFRAKKIVRVCLYQDRGEALKPPGCRSRRRRRERRGGHASNRGLEPARPQRLPRRSGTPRPNGAQRFRRAPKERAASSAAVRGVGRAWRNVRAAWSEYRLDVQEARWAGEGSRRTRAHPRTGERPAASRSTPIGAPWCASRTNKVISAWDWLDHTSALEAAGLEE